MKSIRKNVYHGVTKKKVDDRTMEKSNFSDESKVVIGKDQRIQIWRKNGEGWRPDLYGPKKSSSVVYEVMIWGYICWSGVGTATKIEGNIDAQKYIEVLDESLKPVLIRHFPRNHE